MPRKGKRSQAQKLRWTKLDQDSPRACPPPADAPSRANYGTGVRLPVNPWPVSPFSGKQHKLVIPADAPDKKFVLVIGDSHLRGLVDGVHQMPPDRFSFGFMSTPGACAAELRTEVRNAVLPRDPDLVCVLAPGNNLEASCTVEQSGRDFGLLLTSVRSRWPQLYVMDFVPRLTVEAGLQELLRQEFHRVAARMGVMYLSVAEHFPLRRRKLWCRDGVHLSDTEGMNILVQLLWGATYKQFLTPAPVQQLSPKPTSSPRRFSPILVVRGEATVAQPNNPFDWAVVGRGRKGQPAPAMAQAPPLPLNPVVFSPEVLDVMDQFVPSQLETPVSPASPKVTRVSTPTAELSAVEDASSCSRAPVEQLPQTPSPTKHTWTITDTLSPFQSPARKMMKTGPPPATSSIILDDAPSCSHDPVGKVTQAAAPTREPSAVKDAASCSSSPVEPMMKTGTPPGKSSILLDDEPSCSHDPVGIASARREEHSLRATHSQNDSRYTSFSRNHQCTCIALTFLAFQSEDVHFTTPHLDRVLEQGDSLYVAIKQQLLFEKRFHSNHLAVEELPRQVLTDENIYGVRLSDVRCGYLKAQVNSPGRKQWWLPLAKQLKCLSRDVSLALLLVSPECFAVFRTRSGEYGIFDSHSRSARGLPSPSGRAIMMTFTHLHGLVNHIHRLFRERSAYASYEFVPLSFEREVASPPRPPPQSNVTADVTESNVEDAPQPAAPKLCEEDQDHVSSVEDLPQPEAPKVCEEDQDQVRSVEDSPQSEAHNICEEDHAQQRGTFQEQPGKTDVNVPHVVEHKTSKAAPNVTKLSKQRRQKATRRACKLEQARPQKSTAQKRKLHSQKKNKYATCPEFRVKKKHAVKTKYVEDRHYHRQRLLSSKRYYAKPHVQDKKKKNMVQRYKMDPDFRNTQKKFMAHRYRDPDFQSRHKKYVTQRYKTNPDVRESKKAYNTRMYAHDQRHRLKMIQTLYTRYHSDPDFRLHHIRSCAQHRRNRLASTFQMRYQLQRAQRIKAKYRRLIKLQQKTPKPVVDPVMEAAIFAFRETIRQGPTRVCTVCHRLLFPNQVKQCNRSKYVKNTRVASACLTGKYVHVCGGECSAPCTVPEERLQEWICPTCDGHLTRGQMPSMAVANKLELAPIPPELADLNVLERQLIAKILPFAKIVALPKGQQRAVRGAVVCVPSEVEKTVNCLPRPNPEAQLLQVKLKRHIKYKGHQHFYTVNMKSVLAGLATLKETHSEYHEIKIDESATFENLHDDREEEDQVPVSQSEAAAQPQQSNASEGEKEDVAPTSAAGEQEQLRPGLALDTCMQPPDLAQEILSYGSGIFSIAPAQGNKPVGFFTIPKLESMAFPVQFPTGQNTLDEIRAIKLSPSIYFNVRLFSADFRFAGDQSYLFFAQFVTETHLANSSMSIQMRKGKTKSKDGRRISNRMLQDKNEVEKLIQNQDVTRFMQPLRGTPAYWNKTLKDLHAMARQLGKPTFFLTFSAAEMRWPEVIEGIKAQQGEGVHFSELDWNAKCDILRSNPVTVMRMFEKRVDALMTSLIMSPAQPIGEVMDYFYRVEFQARGSPHIHMLVWIKDAPVLGECMDEDVYRFVDRYISCEKPDPDVDPELLKIVSEVQVHSRNHSKSCKKGNVECRFGFPKLPMDRTILTYDTPSPEEEDDNDGGKDDREEESRRGKEAKSAGKKKAALVKKQKEARDKLKPLRNLLCDPNASFDTLTELLEKCNLTHEQYLDAVFDLTIGSVLYIKRRPNDCWVNAYNPVLLRAWNANMDIQYVIDDYSCMAYMMSYLSKPEHEMTEHLKSVVGDVKKRNVNERDEMKLIMQAYSKHREVSAQEAVARTCSLPLKKCTRNVVFVQTDDNALKMSHPMSRLKNMSPEAEEVWMSGVPEKYEVRPAAPEFEFMCLAEFASEYRILYGRQTEGKQALPLQNDKGFIQKRTKGKCAVIRFPRFSEKKQPEKHYRRLLKLYFPHRSDKDLTSETCPTYEHFYKSGRKWDLGVKSIVDNNMKRYEGYGRQVNNALDKMRQMGPTLNAWNTFAPEVEVDRVECIEQRQHIDRSDDEDEEDGVPDYHVDPKSSTGVPGIVVPKLSPDFVRKMYQSLNQTQASVFYTVREWCLRRVWGDDPEQFFYLVSGGAGCGKSHLIKSIHQEATKILRQLPKIRDLADMSQPTVLLTAFTGTAAFNILGKTLHSILKLPRNLKPPYQGLGNSLDEPKTEPLATEDGALLATVVADVSDCPPQALHIFATNKEVDAHNAATVAALHQDIVDIPADDYKKDPRTGCMQAYAQPVKGGKRDLPDVLQAAAGVRVMVTRNLDVEDGLVNGTFGTIAHIVTRSGSHGKTTVTLLGLRLDNPSAGQRFRKKILGPSDNLAYIEKWEEKMSHKRMVRRQFPMKLAFACTAHKVQGMTLQSAVVSLKRVFEPGMAYVALSRTTSLQGLNITDFEESKIYADPDITSALEGMRRASFHGVMPLLHRVPLAEQTIFTVIHHNTEGLTCHMDDIRAHHELRLADVFCVTETHLSGSVVPQTLHLDGYNIFTRNRHTSYTHYTDMATKDGGGVAVYCRNNLRAEARRYIQNVTDLEFVVVKVEGPVKALIATVYKPPNYSLAKFLPNLQSLLDSLDMMNHQPVIVCGDFNEDLLSGGKKSIREVFQSRGFTQLIATATTEKQTLLDHIYISQPQTCLQAGVLQTYYSYHQPVYCVLNV
ncbi:hypothetical protein JOB18_040958 [Solea senegalensis]|uniref:DNA helicase n=1 Tax=Solea senegalensis TaxID=28829 RepID=A0AAV6PIJ1_SOLSE|nr:hypothetical protein JOB18_040958 [Solea senegalensis]